MRPEKEDFFLRRSEVGKQQKSMFYSQLLLSKKGSLGFVWIAAHCPKRLKKDQIKKADISSSVDKILADEVPIVTHRILAYLLLGVVRIYSMKVEYLFHDCNDVLNKLCEFNTGKRTSPGIGVSWTNYHSITVPKKFELDEFDLELLEDRDITGGNMSSREDIVLADERIKVGHALGLIYKEKVSFPETHSTTYTPPRDVVLPPHMDNGNDLLLNSYGDTDVFVTSAEKLHGTNFLLEDWLSPTMLNGSEKEQMHCKRPSEYMRINFQLLSHEMKCNSVASPSNDRSDMIPCIEDLQENRFSLEDRLDPLVLDEAEERQIQFSSCNENLRTNFRAPFQYSECALIARPSHKKPGIEEELVEHSRIELILHEDEPPSHKKRGIEEEHVEHPRIELNLHEDEPPSHKKRGIEEKHVEHPRIELNLHEDEPPSHKKRGMEEEHVEHPRIELHLHEDEPPSYEKRGIEEVHVEHPRIELNLHENEPCALTRSIDIEQHVEAEKKKFVEVITPEIRKCQKNQEQMNLMTFDVTPTSIHPGVGTPEVATVNTPAPKERVKTLKKRKTLLDLTTVLPSKVFKSWIDYPNDIVHKRRKVPHTLLRAWRANKLCRVPRCFLHPLIHSIPIDHDSIHHKDDTYTAPIADVVSEDYVNSTSMIEVQEQIQDDISPLTPMSRERTPIAPGTPVTHLNSLRSRESRAVADSDILEPTSSHESFEQQPLEFIVTFPNEETNSYGGDNLENDMYSARTRAVGIYLYKKFLDKKKREEDEVLNLTHLVIGKAKKSSARLFYEILVLKMEDCIDVRQEKPYDDILLQEAPKLKQIAEP